MSASPPIRLWVEGTPAITPDEAARHGIEFAPRPGREPADLPDAVLYGADTPEALVALRTQADLPGQAHDSAVVVVTGVTDAALEDELLRAGVEAIVAPGTPDEIARALRHAVQRKRLERSTRTAYATDLATGLPHAAQLLEHMTQLIALREREPAPMVLIALRIEGPAQAAVRLGAEAAHVLRRKVAVRLRSGLRAGDLVAAIGPDMFGVLLAHLEAPSDGTRVAAKLVRTLEQPVVVAGQPCAVAATVGLAILPDHGRDAPSLLRRAVAQAGGTAALGRQDLAARAERAGAAANDATG